MKIRILPFIAATMIIAGSFLSSCLKNDYEEIDYPSISSIESFSLGTLYQTIYKGGSKGQDTIDTISYAKHPFVIDHINRKIYNVDSLPKGVDVSKALAKVVADGNVYYRNKNGHDTLLTSNDSLDFTKEILLKVLTYSPVYKDFRFGKPYTVTVNVHKFNPDSLVWKHYADRTDLYFNNSLSEQKAVFSDNKIYVFGKESDNSIKAYKLAVNKGNITGNWENIALPSVANINTNSVLAYNNDVYYTAGGELYRLSDNSKVGDLTGIANLVSVSNGTMIAYMDNGNFITIDKDGNKISDAGAFENTEDKFDFNTRFFAVSYPASHNKDLWRTTVMSNNNPGNTTANVYSYTGSDNHWGKMTPNYPAICPNLDNISMIKYDGKLYAFGGEYGEGDNKIASFSMFYNSNNNGFDWREEKEDGYMKFDSEIAGYYNNQPYSCVVETDNEGKESFIWFVWHDGKVTRGHLNKFAPKN